MAHYVDVSVDKMLHDAVEKREGRPVLLTNLKTGEGIQNIREKIEKMGNLNIS